MGACGVPLAYMVREEVTVAVPAPTLAPDQPHSAAHGAVQDELIACTLHSHALFKNNNGTVYDLLDQALRTTMYAPTIDHFLRKRDG